MGEAQGNQHEQTLPLNLLLSSRPKRMLGAVVWAFQGEEGHRQGDGKANACKLIFAGPCLDQGTQSGLSSAVPAARGPCPLHTSLVIAPSPEHTLHLNSFKSAKEVDRVSISLIAAAKDLHAEETSCWSHKFCSRAPSWQLFLLVIHAYPWSENHGQNTWRNSGEVVPFSPSVGYQGNQILISKPKLLLGSYSIIP